MENKNNFARNIFNRLITRPKTNDIFKDEEQCIKIIEAKLHEYDMQKWISPKTKKPEIMQEVLTILNTGCYYIGRWDGQFWVFDGFVLSSAHETKVAYWMLLPKPPKQKKYKLVDIL